MNEKKPFVTKEQAEEIAKQYPTPIHLYDEKGIREIPAWAVLKLADYYHVSTDYLLGRTDDPTPPSGK